MNNRHCLGLLHLRIHFKPASFANNQPCFSVQYQKIFQTSSISTRLRKELVELHEYHHLQGCSASLEWPAYRSSTWLNEREFIEKIGKTIIIDIQWEIGTVPKDIDQITMLCINKGTVGKTRRGCHHAQKSKPKRCRHLVNTQEHQAKCDWCEKQNSQVALPIAVLHQHLFAPCQGIHTSDPCRFAGSWQTCLKMLVCMHRLLHKENSCPQEFSALFIQHHCTIAFHALPYQILLLEFRAAQIYGQNT